MYLIVFGAPGVGKGTQAKILSQKLNIPHISTGDILRQAVKNQTELGKKAKTIMDAGELVSDAIMIGIINETLIEDQCKNGCILDGFPRTVQQAEELDKLFTKLNITDVLLISFEAKDDEIVKRLTNRRSCKSCQNIFNLAEIENLRVCPQCGAKDSFYQRNDDTEGVIRNRLEVFASTTRPVLDYYATRREIIHIDGDQKVDDVSRDMLKYIKEKTGIII